MKRIIAIIVRTTIIGLIASFAIAFVLAEWLEARNGSRGAQAFLIFIGLCGVVTICVWAWAWASNVLWQIEFKKDLAKGFERMSGHTYDEPQVINPSDKVIEP